MLKWPHIIENVHEVDIWLGRSTNDTVFPSIFENALLKLYEYRKIGKCNTLTKHLMIED